MYMHVTTNLHEDLEHAIVVCGLIKQKDSQYGPVGLPVLS